MKGTLKTLRALARIVMFVLIIAVGNLLALYVVAGIALRGDWDRVDGAIEKAYNEFID